MVWEECPVVHFPRANQQAVSTMSKHQLTMAVARLCGVAMTPRGWFLDRQPWGAEAWERAFREQVRARLRAMETRPVTQELRLGYLWKGAR